LVHTRVFPETRCSLAIANTDRGASRANNGPEGTGNGNKVTI
jgi:hypothetical protein